MKKIASEVCPKCGSSNVEYDTYEMEDDYIFQKITCNECGCEFTDCYRMVYDGYNLFENGVEHIFDTNGNELHTIDYDAMMKGNLK